MVRSQSISSFQFLAFAYLPTLITKVKHARARVLWNTDFAETDVDYAEWRASA